MKRSRSSWLSVKRSGYMLEPRQLSAAIHSMAKFQHRPSPAWLSTFVTACYEQVTDFKPQEMSSLLWAFAKLDIHPGTQLLEGCSETITSSAAAFGPREMCTSLWALASLAWNPGSSVLDFWLGACHQQLPSASSRDLAQMLWSLAKLHHMPAVAWMSAVLKRFESQCRNANPQDVANTVWALAVLKYNPDPVWLKAVLRYVLSGWSPTSGSSNASSGLISPRDAANIMWGLGSLGHAPDTCTMYCLTSAVVGSPAFRPAPQDISNTLWALAVLKYHPPRKLRRSMIMQTYHALGSIQHNTQGPSPDQDKDFNTSSAHPLDSLTSSSAQLSSWDEMDAEDAYQNKLSPERKSLGSPHLPRESVLMQLARSALENLESTTPQGLVLIIYSLARHRYCPRPAVMSAILDSTCDKIRGFSPQSASMLLWSLGRLRYRPSLEWTRLFLELIMLAKGLVAIDHVPSKLWLDLFCDCLWWRLPHPDAGPALISSGSSRRPEQSYPPAALSTLSPAFRQNKDAPHDASQLDMVGPRSGQLSPMQLDWLMFVLPRLGVTGGSSDASCITSGPRLGVTGGSSGASCITSGPELELSGGSGNASTIASGPEIGGSGGSSDASSLTSGLSEKRNDDGITTSSRTSTTSSQSGGIYSTESNTSQSGAIEGRSLEVCQQTRLWSALVSRAELMGI
eukprot:gene7881-1092_t